MGFRPQTLRRGLVHRQLLGRQAPQGLLQKSPLAGRPGPRFDPQASLFLVEGGPHHLFLWEPPPILARGLPELVMLQAVGGLGISRNQVPKAQSGHTGAPSPHTLGFQGPAAAGAGTGGQIAGQSPVTTPGVGAAQAMLFGKTLPILPDQEACCPNVTDERGCKGLLLLTGQGLELGNPKITLERGPVPKCGQRCTLLSLAPRSRVGRDLNGTCAVALGQRI